MVDCGTREAHRGDVAVVVLAGAAGGGAVLAEAGRLGLRLLLLPDLVEDVRVAVRRRRVRVPVAELGHRRPPRRLPLEHQVR